MATFQNRATSAFVAAGCSLFVRRPVALVHVAEDDARDEHVARLESENASLRAEIAELKARLADLEERLGRTPRNSSMPPSEEGLSKPNRAQRRAEGR